MKKTTNKTDRLDLRVSPEQKEFVEMQAKKQNKNKTKNPQFSKLQL